MYCSGRSIICLQTNPSEQQNTHTHTQHHPEWYGWVYRQTRINYTVLRQSSLYLLIGIPRLGVYYHEYTRPLRDREKNISIRVQRVTWQWPLIETGRWADWMRKPSATGHYLVLWQEQLSRIHLHVHFVVSNPKRSPFQRLAGRCGINKDSPVYRKADGNRLTGDVTLRRRL